MFERVAGSVAVGRPARWRARLVPSVLTVVLALGIAAWLRQGWTISTLEVGPVESWLPQEPPHGLRAPGPAPRYIEPLEPARQTCTGAAVRSPVAPPTPRARAVAAEKTK